MSNKQHKNSIVRVKKLEYGWVTGSRTVLTDGELKEFKEFFPERTKEIRYFDVIVIGGVAHVLSSDSTIVNFNTIVIDDWDEEKKELRFSLTKKQENLRPTILV